LELALLPGVEGYFGVKANHVPTIAQLQPGVVELHDGAEISKYFVSGGFAFVHPNSVTDICVLEAATLDQFDSTAVKQALQVRGSTVETIWTVADSTTAPQQHMTSWTHSWLEGATAKINAQQYTNCSYIVTRSHMQTVTPPPSNAGSLDSTGKAGWKEQQQAIASPATACRWNAAAACCCSCGCC
jgi:F0F1-type ATP synthase epsilon subunit